MDNDTLMNVGAYCEVMLANPTFQFLSGYFEADAVGQLLSTQPHETKLRESIYARVQAHREYLAMLKSFAQKKADAEAPQDQQDIDDPAVHNIHIGQFD